MNEPVPSRLNDFPDWISPMLVKELRQGLRTKVFVFTFIALQVMMTLTVVVGLIAAAGGAETMVLSGFLWAIVGLVMLFILPFSALGSLGGEIRANTLELVFLTRLSTWRIVWGKWVAVVVQTLLFLCAVLPYIVLRYFMGGVNITSDLVSIGTMFVGSISISAAMVAVSAYSNWLARVILGLGLLVGLNLLPSIFVMVYLGRAMAGAAMSAPEPMIYPFGAVFVILFILLMLEMGTGLIAPSSENHSAIKRLIGVGFLALAAVATFMLAAPQGILIYCMLAVGPILLGAVCEREESNPAIYRPFVRRGIAGRLAGRFFYSGWPSGIPYAVLLLAGFAAVVWNLNGFDEIQGRMALLSVFGTVAFVGTIIRVFFPRTDRALGVVVVLLLLSGFIAVLMGVLDSALHWNARPLMCFLPPTAFLFSATSAIPQSQMPIALIALSLSTAICVIILFLYLVRGWIRMGRLERVARESVNGVA